ncbi:MAG: hypothetical protein OEW06_09045 [Gemmatimonadota bacterium]|nr:hypothetical protein [Gemmatimonadota bacterium]
MDHAEDRRWTARRKFWFPSGILVDRRGIERRAGADRRISVSASLPKGVSVDRRVTPDRRQPADSRRSGERRLGPRRPSDRTQEPPK